MFEVSDVDSQAVARSAHSVLSPGSAMARAGRKRLLSDRFESSCDVSAQGMRLPGGAGDVVQTAGESVRDDETLAAGQPRAHM